MADSLSHRSRSIEWLVYGFEFYAVTIEQIQILRRQGEFSEKSVQIQDYDDVELPSFRRIDHQSEGGPIVGQSARVVDEYVLLLVDNAVRVFPDVIKYGAFLRLEGRSVGSLCLRAYPGISAISYWLLRAEFGRFEHGRLFRNWIRSDFGSLLDQLEYEIFVGLVGSSAIIDLLIYELCGLRRIEFFDFSLEIAFRKIQDVLLVENPQEAQDLVVRHVHAALVQYVGGENQAFILFFGHELQRRPNETVHVV